MDFRLDGDQLAMQTEARRYLSRKYPAARTAELADSEIGWDPQSWSDLAAMGWLGVDVPVALGGVGLGFVEVVVVLEQLGQVLYPGPYFSTVVLARPALGDEELRTLVDGSVRWSAEVDQFVPDLGAVDRVVTAAGAVDAVGTMLDTSDGTRRIGRLTSGLPATPTGPLDRSRIHAGAAAEAVGVAQRALELATDHARTRAQFGKAIGSFQAISHPLARCHVEIELARSLTYWAAWCIDHDRDRAGPAAAAAKAHATETAVRVCEQAIQVLGGLGFTWEHHLHRGYKRALALRVFCGTPTELRRFVADSVIGPAVGARG